MIRKHSLSYLGTGVSSIQVLGAERKLQGLKLGKIFEFPYAVLLS